MRSVQIEIECGEVEVTSAYTRGKVKVRFKCEASDIAEQIATNEIIEGIGKEAVMEYWGLVEEGA